MPNTRIANAVRLEFEPGALVHANLSGAAFSGDWLWVAGDEACGLDRLRRLDVIGKETLRYGDVRSFPLAELLDLPGDADEEADLEGMAIVDGYLWVVGSHGHKRKNAKADRSHAENAKRLSKLSLDGNRRLLACLPIENNDAGEPCLVRVAKDGRRARRIKGDCESNALTQLIDKDVHFGAYMSIPGKDNGFDIEGLAVDGQRMFLGLRGPVLRGWSAILEIAVALNEKSGNKSREEPLKLVPLDDTGIMLRKHFLQLDGLGIRDLHFSGDDLYILAGSTMVLNGEIRVYKWAAAKPLLAANREPVRFESNLAESVALPHGRGTNRAEAICDLPPQLACGKPRWLVLYDAPGPDRKDGEYTVYGDLLRHD
jgi:Protein of unknown function (DUF3616)